MGAGDHQPWIFARTSGIGGGVVKTVRTGGTVIWEFSKDGAGWNLRVREDRPSPSSVLQGVAWAAEGATSQKGHEDSQSRFPSSQGTFILLEAGPPKHSDFLGAASPDPAPKELRGAH